MKIAYPHLLDFLKEKPSLDELSDKLLQLGHEHEIEGDIIDLEITPNRGDCLSLKGIARDLNYFYKAELGRDIYDKNIPKSDFSFQNNAKDLCPNISFLEIEIDGPISDYKPYLEHYFKDLKINKNNFFTDVSNYLAYETGQPTHCYDASKINDTLVLEKRNKKEKFKTLLGSEIELEGENLVFTIGGIAVDLAGTMGDESTACNNKTTKVLVECAYFKPEEILGKARQYNLTSEAAYKFERGVDYLAQESVLRRFLAIVSDHTKIKSLSMYSEQNKIDLQQIDFDSDKLNSILGTNIKEKDQLKYLESLGFRNDKSMVVPSHRSDLEHINDLAEEVARMVGYNNIAAESLALGIKVKSMEQSLEEKCKNLFVYHGFFEVINMPFTADESELSISVDNSLDKQRSKLRTNLMNSLKNNLAYNQNRQKDSIKFFEIADIYTKASQEKRMAALVNGRSNKNFKEFNVQLDYAYLKGLLNTIAYELLGEGLTYNHESCDEYEFFEHITLKGNDIGGIGKLNNNLVNSKSKTPVFAFEICLDGLNLSEKKIEKTSDYPAIFRDISMSIDNPEVLKELSDKLTESVKKMSLIKESFIFDYFENKKLNVMKVGYRFKFQTEDKSLTDKEVDALIKVLTDNALSINGVNIEGL